LAAISERYNCGAATAAVGGLPVGAMADASQPPPQWWSTRASAVPLWTQVSSLLNGCEKMKVNSTL
jgi:hypothetical protein